MSSCTLSILLQAVAKLAPPSSKSLSGAVRAASTLPKNVTESELPTIQEGRQAFKGDLRSTSALGIGDDIHQHTPKWLQGSDKSPMEMLQEEPPMKVKGLRVASHGGDGDDIDALGCPIEYIDLRGSTYEHPAVCKYTGNKFYSDDWKGGGGAH